MAVKDVSSEDVSVRLKLACGDNVRVLSQLAEDPDAYVRLIVYLNPDTPEDAKKETGFDTEGYLYGINWWDSQSSSFDGDEWLWHVADGDPDQFRDNAVVLLDDGTFEYDDAAWWDDAIQFLRKLDKIDSLDAILETYGMDENTKALYDYDHFSDYEWEEVLTELYNLGNQNLTRTERITAAVKLLNPDINFEQITLTSPYNDTRTVTILYDADNLDYMHQDELTTWYFWDIYEATYDYIYIDKLEDVPISTLVRQIGSYGLFGDYGEAGDGPALIEGPEFRKLQEEGKLLKHLANEFNLPVEFCELT